MSEDAIRSKLWKITPIEDSMREFQHQSSLVWNYDLETPMKYDLKDEYLCHVGLAGETGEILEIMKKYVRNPEACPIDTLHLTKEIGDVLLQLAMICQMNGINIADCAQAVIDKSIKRMLEGSTTDPSSEQKKPKVNF